MLMVTSWPSLTDWSISETLKVGGALEPVSEERRFWLGLSFMVGVRGQVSPGSGNSSGGLRYSSSEVMGLLKGDVDPPGFTASAAAQLA